MTSKEALLYLATTDRRNTKIGDEAKNILWELVERDTPNRVFSTDYHYCGNCKTQYLSEYQKFCDNCGQRLVWDKSDDYIKKLKEK